ncbi:MAG: endonuclease III [Eggerthellaceae bacterium]|nr:endonuclease III [Eggerthellaceae bacterium]
MPRESLKSKRERAAVVASKMNDRYGEAETELIYDGDPFHLVIAVLLSAQTTDKAVNKVTPVLWERYPTLESLACAQQADVEEILRSIGFFRTKAAHVIECARMVLEDFGGKVPSTMSELTKLPGVGRKTANIVLNVAFDDVEGIAVDTHVFRISHMLKLSNAPTPQATEFDLLKIFDRKDWKPINHQLVRFGREVCVARRPKCDICELVDICPNAKKAQ